MKRNLVVLAINYKYKEQLYYDDETGEYYLFHFEWKKFILNYILIDIVSYVILALLIIIAGRGDSLIGQYVGSLCVIISIVGSYFIKTKHVFLEKEIDELIINYKRIKKAVAS